ncbi:C-type lectin domain family 4 member F-like isoform X2 [Mercenaria mercenaria]|uniref:C-type lectin domain family 4 member F-like isoform X2 n=1 Tax=Mercenaria mercenaria TaxID=6596 RepID=UPI00234F1E95|nr:C-type lectin domain family 4 member F-like isoform X2 [Mercenaria mercenaria]
MILLLIIIIGVYSTFGTSTASVSTDVWKKLTEIETILVDMVAQIADVKERLDTEKESTTACPDRWVAYKGSFCYFGSTTVTFSEAQDICTSLGAHLVHVDNYLENVFLKGFMNSHSKNCYWVGLTDAAKEGLWKLTGKNTIAPFLDWGSSEQRWDF